MIQATHVNNAIELRISNVSKLEFNDLCDTIKAIPGRTYQDGAWLVPDFQLSTVEQLLGGQLVWTETVTPIDTTITKVQKNNLDVLSAALSKVPLKFQPYGFQVLGSAYLIDQARGVLGDEMGLGKTIQAILASYYLKLEGQANQVLVIAPASLKYQWGEEIAKFTDLTYQVIDGTPKQRQAMYEASPQPFFTLINYELARLDFDLNYLKAANYDIIVLDEAHRIKNFETVTAQQFKASLNAPYKWLLTGTPLQNKVEELYSLFEFMDPDILGNWWKFRSRYIVLGSKFGRHNIPVGYKNQNELRTRVQPYIFRRLKADVRAELPDLPEMLINNYTIPMTSAQTTMYKRVLDEIRVIGEQMMQWNQDTPFPREMEVFGLFTVLSELCTAPELLTLSNSSLARKFIPSDLKSPKLAELKNIVAGIMTEPTSKIVIFSQFERLQSIIASTLSSYGKSVFLNGSMQAYERQVSMDKFRFDDEVKFFISTDAGNYGLNLQNAPYLINMDLHWNPAIWWQRAGRIHRIGSKHESVQVISLVSKDSIDEIILRANYAKMDMSNFLIEKSDYDRMVVDKLTAKVIRKLLAS